MESLQDIWGMEKAEEITDLVKAIAERYDAELTTASLVIGAEMVSMISNPYQFIDGIRALLLSGVVLYRELLLEYGAQIFDVEEKIMQGSKSNE